MNDLKHQPIGYSVRFQKRYIQSPFSTIAPAFHHFFTLQAAEIPLKPLRKKNSKRQYPPWEVYLQQAYRKRVETTNSLIEQLLPKSIHAVTAAGFQLKVFLFIIATNIKLLFT